MSSTQGVQSDAVTYRKSKRGLVEKNAERRYRSIRWRDRPIHGLAKFSFLRKWAKHQSLTHWALQIGEEGEGYVWELEVQNGKVTYHIGIWEVPKKKLGLEFVGTKNDGDPSIAKSTKGHKIGETNLTDFEIKARGQKSHISHCCRHNRELTHPTADQVAQDMKKERGSMISRILAWYNPMTYAQHGFKALSPKWRSEHTYDEGNNNCQDFAKRLARAIHDTATTTTLQKKPTAKKWMDLLKWAYWSSTAVPALPR
ncbi:MAG: hypothetical protein LQ346_008076 [Caloplaca aetnensis]|nr:MAG: hypothetical protein LQ346_008076 [Caloplaca aetnensis]